MKNMHKGSILVWTILCVVAVLIIAGGVYFSSKNLSSQPNSLNRIYADTQDGFEFTYPYPSTQTYPTGIISVSTTSESGFVSDDTSHYPYKFSYQSDNTFAFKNDTNGAIGSAVCPETRTVGGVTYYVSHLSGFYTGGGNDDSRYFVLTNKNYAISVSFYDTPDHATSSVARFLSSLTFTGDTKQLEARCEQAVDSNTGNLVPVHMTYTPGKFLLVPVGQFFVKDNAHVYYRSDLTGEYVIIPEADANSFESIGQQGMGVPIAQDIHNGYGFDRSGNLEIFTGQSDTIAAVTYPQGGEVFNAGQQVRITWQAKGLEKISLYLTNPSSEKDFKGVIDIADSVDPSTGSYTWTIPQTIRLESPTGGFVSLDQNKYAISIVKFDYDGKGLDEWSSKPFTIQGI